MSVPKPVIEVVGLGKRFRIREGSENYLTLRDQIAGFASGALTSRRNERDFWALRDVSFTVSEGEAVGIIGRNGSGKSTLLKILSQITPPTEGHIRMRGRVASLLEVGTGFHPELSGRENIFLNGSILGMKRREIQSKFDEIVSFSELGAFLDTPVKRYSSGMYVKLAFSVAAHLDPEILIVDEVLAVGDRAFQKRCLGKMGEVTRGGRTVIFVSHDIEAVMAFCTAGVHLRNGRTVALGKIDECIHSYIAPLEERANCDDIQRHRSGLGIEARIMHCRATKNASIGFTSEEPVRLQVGCRVTSALPPLRIAITIHNQRGRPLATAFTQTCEMYPGDQLITLCVELPPGQLGPGTYFVSLQLGTGNQYGDRYEYDIVSEATAITIRPDSIDKPNRLNWFNSGWGDLMTLRAELTSDPSSVIPSQSN